MIKFTPGVNFVHGGTRSVRMRGEWIRRHSFTVSLSGKRPRSVNDSGHLAVFEAGSIQQNEKIVG
jgi:hypothetical protein